MNNKDSLSHRVKSGRWVFDKEVAEVFDDMLFRSVPGLERACNTANLLFSSIEKFRPSCNNYNVLDLGIGTGTTCQKIIPNPNSKAVFGIDTSFEMIEKARNSLRYTFGKVTLEQGDIKDPLPLSFPSKFGVILSVLTMMFVPPDYRLSVLQRLREALSREGSLFIMEKTVPSSIPMIVRDSYRQYKLDSGYTVQQVNEKEASLQGVLIPQSPDEWERMFKVAGFESVELVFAELQFRGWLLRKTV